MNEEDIVILEFNASDNMKHLSNRVLSLKDMNQWRNTDRAKVLELVVNQCLRWPKGIFNNLCYKNSTLNHPRLDSKSHVVSESVLKKLG